MTDFAGNHVELEAIAAPARRRIPEIRRSIEATLSLVDPRELLAQLTILNLAQRLNEPFNPDDLARWQVRVEWLTWLVLWRKTAIPDNPTIVDARILDSLEKNLDELISATAMTLMSVLDPHGGEQDHILFALRSEALHVRGEGFPAEVEWLAMALFSPHEEACRTLFGFTVADAILIVNRLSALIEEKTWRLRQNGVEVEAYVRLSPDHALGRIGLSSRLVEQLRLAATGGMSDDEIAHQARFLWTFTRAHTALAASCDEVSNATPELSDAVVRRVFECFSIRYGQQLEEPDLFRLNPLARRPLVQWSDDVFYAFVPPLLRESVLNYFHFALLENPETRTAYDDARSQWLENMAMDCLRSLVPNGEAASNLHYGSKKSRAELDGLLLFDDELLLVECKWKGLSLTAREGKLDAFHKDVAGSFLAALKQGQRASDFVRSTPRVRFTTRSRSEINISVADVNRITIITLTGRGAWARIAANLDDFLPRGAIRPHDAVWALPIHDLVTVRELLTLPLQLFDYLDWRESVRRSGKFHVHDEWDLLAAYLDGMHPEDPRFADQDFVGLAGYDSNLQRYYAWRSRPELPAEPRPSRTIPSRIVSVLKQVESSGLSKAITAAKVLYAFSDRELLDVDQKITTVMQKTRWDGGFHAVAVAHPFRQVGITVGCVFEDPDRLRHRLRVISSEQQRVHMKRFWLDVGILLPLDGTFHLNLQIA